MLISKFYLNLSMYGAKPTGLGVYSAHCAGILEERFDCNVFTHYYLAQDQMKVVWSPSYIAMGEGRLSALRRIIYSLYGFCEKNAFIYNPTHHGMLFHNNQVITIHDLIPLHHPEQYKLQYYYFRFYLPLLIRKCRAILTVSETAKSEICEYYHLSSDMVYVIPNGVDSETFLFKGSTRNFCNENPYLLVIGAAFYHKNVHELLQNFQCWQGRYKIKIASSRGRYGEYLQTLVTNLGLTENVEFLGYVSPEQLVELYQKCEALVFPSLSEGFGLPPIECLASGRPVIVSDIAVHKEVLGEAAIYITSNKPESWSTAFDLLRDPTIVARKIEAGKKVVAKFSWENSGELLVGTLLEIEPELRRFLL